MSSVSNSKLRRTVARACKFTIYIVIIPFIFVNLVFQVLNTSENSQPNIKLTQDSTHHENGVTVWDVLRNDSRISRFADVVEMFDDIVMGLKAEKASFNVFAPLNAAFEAEHFENDLPWFYWKFLAGYSMGPGGLSVEQLKTTRTVSSFINADIFFTYKQRISIQHDHGKIMLNHKVNLIEGGRKAANGYVHIVDGLVRIPDATGDILRERGSLSKLKTGLIQTGLSDMVNDTNTHVGQTLFAPTNSAFEKLGSKTEKFLFSRAGRPYLKALLKGQIVANHTLLSDIYFPHGGMPQQTLDHGSQVELHTLHASVNLTAQVGRTNSGLGLTVDGDMHVSAPDIVVMDGVVHEVDTFLLLNEKHDARPQAQGPLPRVWKRWLSSGSIGVEELMHKLEPLLED